MATPLIEEQIAYLEAIIGNLKSVLEQVPEGLTEEDVRLAALALVRALAADLDQMRPRKAT